MFVLDPWSRTCSILHVSVHTMATSTGVASKSVSLRRGAPIREREFLLFVGTRVRELRNRRGMTRKMVAQEGDVSERHLAQLESGGGNISILLLRRSRCFPHRTPTAPDGVR